MHGFAIATLAHSSSLHLSCSSSAVKIAGRVVHEGKKAQ